MTDKKGTLVWRADHRPFGEASVDEDPDGDGTQVTLNLRFPGQYFDKETGLHYNYFRDYHPGIGRYVEPDPIRDFLVRSQDGFNTFLLFVPWKVDVYQYCDNNPLNLEDSNGAFAGYVYTFMAAYAIGSFASQLHIWLPVYNAFDQEIARTRELLKTYRSVQEFHILDQHLKWLVTEQARVASKLGFDFLITGYNLISPSPVHGAIEIPRRDFEDDPCETIRGVKKAP